MGIICRREFSMNAVRRLLQRQHRRKTDKCDCEIYSLAHIRVTEQVIGFHQ